VFISSELDEVVRLSDTIVVLRDRREVETIVNGPAVTADTIVGIIAREGDAA
jgi:monosaccharide-transporting ATPase